MDLTLGPVPRQSGTTHSSTSTLPSMIDDYNYDIYFLELKSVRPFNCTPRDLYLPLYRIAIAFYGVGTRV
jgi:hypothetical protein